MKKQFLFLFFGAALFAIPHIHAMEEQSSDELRQEEVVEIATQNEEQSQDDTLITVNLEDGNDQIAFSIDLPYKAVKLSNTLHHNISFDQNTENKIITISVANISGIEIREFKTTLEVLKLSALEKFKKEYLARTLTKKSILKLLNVANYLDCAQLRTIFIEALQHKLQKLLFEKNKLKKALHFVQIFQNTDHYDHLLDVAGNNVKNKQLKYSVKSEKQLQGHADFVTALCFSPNNNYLASASDDDSIKIWDPASGSCLTTLKGHTKSVTSICFFPDGNHLASASYDGTVKVWDLASGSCSTIFNDQYRLTSVSVSPDGHYLALGSYDTTITLLDLISKSWMQPFEGHCAVVESVCFSSDSNCLVSGSADGTIKVWDPISGSCLKTFKGHYATVYSVCFSPNGDYLASGASNGTVKLWNPISGSCLKTFDCHHDVNSVRFSPDSNCLASASYDDTVKFLDPVSGSCVQTFKNHPYDVNAICFSPNGTLFAYSLDNSIGIYTFFDLKKDFTLSSLLLLEYVLHHIEQGTLQQLPSEPFYFDLYVQLPKIFQEMVDEAFDQDALKVYLENKIEHKCVIS